MSLTLHSNQGSQWQAAKRLDDSEAKLHSRRQFTSKEWTSAVESYGAKVSMDGKGRWVDNVFIERLWRSLKYEKLRLWSYRNIPELCGHVDTWMSYYNHSRKHQTLDYATPWSLYRPEKEMKAA